MLLQVKIFLENAWEKYQSLWVCMLLAVVSVAIRSPFFNVPLIDQDEGCYLVVGQDILRGNLPYEQLWCNKPPLGFFFFAALTALLGKSLFAIRAAGSLYIASGAFIVYLAGRSLRQAAAGIYAALVVVALASFTFRGMALNMEHVALVPLALLAHCLVQKITPLRLLWMGFLVGIALLIRTNLGFLLPGLLISVAWLAPRRDVKTLLHPMALVIGGALIPLVVMGGIYYARGTGAQFIIAMYTMPLAFVQTEASRPLQSISQLKTIFLSYYFWGWQPSYFSGWLLFIAGFMYTAFEALKRNDSRKIPLMALVVMTVFTLLSIFATGARYPHYLIQLLPFGALLVGLFLSKMFHTAGRAWSAIPALFIGACLYANLAGNMEIKPPVGTDYTLAAYLNTRGVQEQYIFSPDECLVYFLTGARVPVSEVHPASFAKLHLLKAMHGDDFQFMRYAKQVLDKNPRFIILNQNPNSLMRQSLAVGMQELYEKDTDIDNYTVYRRKQAGN